MKTFPSIPKTEAFALNLMLGGSMFLLRQELACLRDLPNIRGDYYRQRGRGGGRILIYRVSRNHIMVDNISYICWLLHQNTWCWILIADSWKVFKICKLLANISPQKIFLVHSKDECGGSECPLQSSGVDTWHSGVDTRWVKSLSQCEGQCCLCKVSRRSFRRLLWASFSFTFCWDCIETGVKNCKDTI